MTQATQDNKARKIGYWVTTVLVGLALAPAGVNDLIAGPEMVAGIEGLGYPKYLLYLLGVAKLLAVITIFAPKFPRLKEWAYAGIAVNMVGASYSHAMNGDPMQNVVTPLMILAIAMGSWYLRPADRKLPDRQVAA